MPVSNLKTWVFLRIISETEDGNLSVDSVTYRVLVICEIDPGTKLQIVHYVNCSDDGRCWRDWRFFLACSFFNESSTS